MITSRKKRKGKKIKVGRKELSKVSEMNIPFINSHAGVLNDWLNAIEKDQLPTLHAKVAANMTMAGIAASEAARSGSAVEIPVYTSKQ